MSSYVMLGKTGDICSLLPILQADFRRTLLKSTLIVSEEYAASFRSLDFLNLSVYPGRWDDLYGAIRWAKERYPNVFIAQTHGERGTSIIKRHPSFQYDQWDRCGRLKDWGQLLEIAPVTDFELTIGGRYILLADHSQSSPFEKIEDLYQLLVDTFPSHRIVRLSTVRVAQLLHLLVIYGAAELLVTIDTMHLHWSIASKVPVIALVVDSPSRWRGSAYHPRMTLHVRYGDYEQRKSQIVWMASRIVNRLPSSTVTWQPTQKAFGYNLSSARTKEGVWTTYRFHPNPESWRTEMMLRKIDHEVPIKAPNGYEKHSLEDGRLFTFKGETYISLTVSRSPMGLQKFSPCVTGYGKLNGDGTIEGWTEPRIGKNDWSAQEKNFVCFEHGGMLHVIYQCSPRQVIYVVDKSGNAVRKYESECAPCSLGDPRGGTQPISFDGKWLRFCHVNQINKKSDLWWTYHLVAIVMESEPPFRILQVSQQPILSGTEEYFPDHKFWKPRVCIPYGAIEHEGTYYVALGLNDSACATAKITREMLNL